MSDPRAALAEGYWSVHESIQLCAKLVNEGLAFPAGRNGVCPIHGGDACLVDYVHLISARRRVAELFYQAEADDE